MPRIEHIVTVAEEGRTVKSLALRELRVSRGLFSSLKFSGGVRLDGEVIHADARVRAGQTLSLEWRDSGMVLTPHPMPLRIVYEDPYYWIIDKPAPLPTLCSARQAGATLENALYAHLGCPEDFVFRPVNRLDKGTSGLMAAALHPQAQAALQKQLHISLTRRYLAVTEGVPSKASGRIDLPIGKISPSSVLRAVMPGGKSAVTDYAVLRSDGKRALISLSLMTGRTHQIRVHLAAIGCPVAGDYLYGTPLPGLEGRFALHSCALMLDHPVTSERLSFESPLPPALAALLND